MRFTSCFVGIPLSEKYQSEFEQLLDNLGHLLPGAQLVRKQTPHITLYYLDAQSQDNISEITQVIERCKSIVRGSKVRVGRLGFFDPGFPRVLFAKVEHEDQLNQINQKFRQDLKMFYAEDNNMSFHAHVTLARLPNDEARQQFNTQETAIKELLAAVHWYFEISELVLYGVDSTQGIESHTKLARFEF